MFMIGIVIGAVIREIYLTALCVADLDSEDGKISQEARQRETRRK